MIQDLETFKMVSKLNSKDKIVVEYKTAADLENQENSARDNKKQNVQSLEDKKITKLLAAENLPKKLIIVLVK